VNELNSLANLNHSENTFRFGKKLDSRDRWQVEFPIALLRGICSTSVLICLRCLEVRLCKIKHWQPCAAK
jgi:hypothetical protein